MGSFDQVQRQPAPGPFGGGAKPDVCGPASPDVGWKPRKGEVLQDENTAPSDVGAMARLPMELPEGRVVVVCPRALLCAAPAEIEVLFHLHGFYRHGYQHLRDRDIYKIEQQIQASAHQRLIGILPQGKDDPENHKKHPTGDFDGDYREDHMPDVANPDATSREVAKRLFGKEVPVKRTILSGHSAGGRHAMGAAGGKHAPKDLGGLMLFDGINGDAELEAVKTFVRGKLDQDLARVRQLKAASKSDQEIVADLEATGFRFRGVHGKDSYKGRYGRLAADHKKKGQQAGLDDWFAEHAAELGGAGAPVYDALRKHYVIKQVDQPNLPGEDAHESVMSAGDDIREGLDAMPADRAGRPAGQAVQPRAAAGAAASVLSHWADEGSVQAVAREGLAGGGGALPHLEAIQRSFGPAHDLGGVQAHVGAEAKQAAGRLDAEAYASGDRVAFSAAPDLRLAAHEAAHVVQQRAGVSLPGGLGRSGDAYERQADAVAERVVAGQSAADLLPGAGARAGGAVQRDEKKDAQQGGDKKADEKDKVPDKIQLTVKWSAMYKGDLSGRLTVYERGADGKRGRQLLSQDAADGETGDASAELTVDVAGAAHGYVVVFTPTVAAPDDRYRESSGSVALKAPYPDKATAKIAVDVNRWNEKNMYDSWDKAGIDRTLADDVEGMTVCGKKVQLNKLCAPKVKAVNDAFGALSPDEQKRISDSLLTVGGYARRTQTAGGFSDHSVGCAIDVNANMGLRQNDHFMGEKKTKKRDQQFLEFVQEVVRSDPAHAAFDIIKDQDEKQLEGARAFNLRFPLYLQDLMIQALSGASGKKNEDTLAEVEADRTLAVIAELLPLLQSAALPMVLEREHVQVAAKAAKNKEVKRKLGLILENWQAFRAWELGGELKEDGSGKVLGTQYTMIPLDQRFLRIMRDAGWSWGGNWSSEKDYMHFEDEAAMAALKTRHAGGHGGGHGAR